MWVAKVQRGGGASTPAASGGGTSSNSPGSGNASLPNSMEDMMRRGRGEHVTWPPDSTGSTFEARIFNALIDSGFEVFGPRLALWSMRTCGRGPEWLGHQPDQSAGARAAIRAAVRVEGRACATRHAHPRSLPRRKAQGINTEEVSTPLNVLPLWLAGAVRHWPQRYDDR